VAGPNHVDGFAALPRNKRVGADFHVIFRKEAAFDRHCERGDAIHGPAAARSPNSPRKQPEDVQTAYSFRPRPRTAEAPFSACSEVEPGGFSRNRALEQLCPGPEVLAGYSMLSLTAR